ncbi:hypothetical protein CONCODRAFT_4242 [Conidiobolus coronatus NRRL 28638]|uniref:Breast carcinoma amplified sequence 2 n=1 Tax=Conidiobolus coronatus (strain ATCC 28846 / CBS 209.66 / NRRL 28638) TaxID=796925 RepID=A0A137PCX1_CONC2|nr:hypothetical protein CONCODRAFT_4242 [Conidiobolus coronatus NRRL 28638]|eukprot:KXN72847.1 hypothetical protein CONCODRAFT_4242 [Conidiobolus coronatus NRRL 28638]
MVVSVNPLFDALPYADKELKDAKLQEQAELLIEQEMNLDHPDYIENCDLPKELDTSKLELFEQELSRIKAEESLNGLSLDKYQKNLNEMDADEVNTMVEHQTVRNINLNLLEKYGINTWTVNHFQLEKLSSNLETELSYLKEQTLGLHKQRKAFHLDQGRRIEQLKKKFKDSINTNLQLELAVEQLEIQSKQTE